MPSCCSIGGLHLDDRLDVGTNVTCARNDGESRELLSDVTIADGGAILNIPRPAFAIPVKVLTGGDEDQSNLEVLRSSLS
ncbi:hypothetical protein NL676_027323 [Syzygium grande]|nr:hypothetical protein NL676_027323 [Syzygium grande]